MGLSTARAFAEAGAAVALADVNEAAVRPAADGLVAGGRKAFGFAATTNCGSQKSRIQIPGYAGQRDKFNPTY
jgi:NAD(P)-dependent dehydrogenase (short-subunit alcohol dehydrogenase family)